MLQLKDNVVTGPSVVIPPPTRPMTVKVVKRIRKRSTGKVITPDGPTNIIIETDTSGSSANGDVPTARPPSSIMEDELAQAIESTMEMFSDSQSEVVDPNTVTPRLRKRLNRIQRLVRWYNTLFLNEEREAQTRVILEDCDNVEYNGSGLVALRIGSEARLKFMPRTWSEANELAIGRWIHNQVRDNTDVRIQDRERISRLALLRAFTPSRAEVEFMHYRNSQARALRLEDLQLASLPAYGGLWTRIKSKVRRFVLPTSGPFTVPEEGRA